MSGRNHGAVEVDANQKVTNEYGVPDEKGTEYRMGAEEGEIHTTEHELKRSLKGRHMQMIAVYVSTQSVHTSLNANDPPQWWCYRRRSVHWFR